VFFCAGKEVKITLGCESNNSLPHLGQAIPFNFGALKSTPVPEKAKALFSSKVFNFFFS
jgi:hypothetical protein